MSPDGTRLAFASNRPTAPGGKALDGEWDKKAYPEGGGNLWYVDRTATGWSAPQRYPDVINGANAIFTPSLVESGSLYFMKPGLESGHFHLYRSEWKDGAYQPAERLGFSDDDRWTDCDPAVASDESYVVFSSTRPPAAGDLDLFIVFRQAGAWGQPVHLGSINSGAGEIEARLAPDDHTLYFTSRRTAAIHYPKPADVSAQSVASMKGYNSGLQHIWRVDLAPWIERAGGRVPQRAHACTPP
jgi:hypothetical protein